MSSRFGAEIQNRIREKGLSVNRLAALAGVRQPHLQMVVKGQRSISQEDARRVLDALGIKGQERLFLLDLAALTLLPKRIGDGQRERIEELVARGYNWPDGV